MLRKPRSGEMFIGKRMPIFTTSDLSEMPNISLKSEDLKPRECSNYKHFVPLGTLQFSVLTEFET